MVYSSVYKDVQGCTIVVYSRIQKYAKAFNSCVQQYAKMCKGVQKNIQRCSIVVYSSIRGVWSSIHRRAKVHRSCLTVASTGLCNVYVL